MQLKRKTKLPTVIRAQGLKIDFQDETLTIFLSETCVCSSGFSQIRYRCEIVTFGLLIEEIVQA